MEDFNILADPYGDEVETVLTDEEELYARIIGMTRRVNKKHRDADSDLILVVVLKGAVPFLTDFVRQLSVPSQMEFVTVSSYGGLTPSSDVVRILRSLGRDIEEYDVVIIKDVIDSGLIPSQLMKNLYNRNSRSLEVIALLCKPEAVHTSLDAADVSFDIPSKLVIGYSLDYAKRHRDLLYVGTLHPRVYQGQVYLRRLLHGTDALRWALRTYLPTVLAGFQL